MNLRKNKILKVLMIEPIGKIGGMHHYNNSLLTELCKLNINIKLVTSVHTKNDFNPDIEVNYSFGKLFRSKNNFFNLFFLAKGCISSLLQSFNEKRNIIHLHFFGFKFHFLLLFFLFYFFRRKIILTIHDVEEITKKNRNSLFLKLSLFIFHLSDACIVHNNFTKKTLNQFSKNRFNHLYTVHHGNYDDYVDRMNYAYKGTSKYKNIFKAKCKHILFFGKVKANKGLDTLIDGYKRFFDLNISKKIFKLIIVGSINDKKLHEDLLLKLTDKKRYEIFTFFEFVSEKDLHYLFTNSDLIILPYNQIYQSGVMLLAIAYKKPILLSDLEPFKEIITDSKNHHDILFFKKNNYIDLSKKLSLFFQKKKKISKYKFKLDNDYSWNIIAKKMYNIYLHAKLNESKKK